MTLAKEQAVLQIAEMIGEHDTRVWRVIKHYVNKLRMATSFSNISRLGIDETSSRRGHRYVTVFSDLDERKVVFATEGKEAATIERFKKAMPVHNGAPKQIKEVAIDMSPAFISGVAANFPYNGPQNLYKVLSSEPRRKKGVNVRHGSGEEAAHGCV